MTVDAALTEKGPIDVKQASAADLRMISVTNILSCLDKPALVHWAAQKTAQAAIAVAASLSQRIAEEGEDEVERWLTNARFRRAKGELSDTEAGSLMHGWFEEYALSGVRPPVPHPSLAEACDRGDEWLQLWQPEYEAAEMTVYSLRYGYAGTEDAIVRIGGQVLDTDYKFSKRSFDNQGKRTGPYPEVALQLAAYRHAEYVATWRPRRLSERWGGRFYLLGPDELEMAVPRPRTDGGIVIKITPQHCTAYPVRCDSAVFDAFLYVLEVSRWRDGLSKSVIGAPLEPA